MVASLKFPSFGGVSAKQTRWLLLLPTVAYIWCANDAHNEKHPVT